MDHAIRDGERVGEGRDDYGDVGVMGGEERGRTNNGRTEDVLQRNKRFASLLFPLLPGRTNGMEPMD